MEKIKNIGLEEWLNTATRSIWKEEFSLGKIRKKSQDLSKNLRRSPGAGRERRFNQRCQCSIFISIARVKIWTRIKKKFSNRQKKNCAKFLAGKKHGFFICSTCYFYIKFLYALVKKSMYDLSPPNPKFQVHPAEGAKVKKSQCGFFSVSNRFEHSPVIICLD